MARLVSWLVVFVAVVAAVPAAADPRTERDARALQKKAIEEDNLNVNYAAAVKKLQTAVNRCGNDRCNPQLKASLYRDLGAMQLLSGNVDAGKASFAQAIRLDPTLDLDPSYKNPMLDGVWTDVKSHAGGAPPAAAAGGGAAPAAGGGGGAAPAGGDFSHTPPSEALVRTPLAIYVEYNGGDQLARVIAKYKVGNTWKTLELKKFGDGFGANIPCKDVTQGTVQYYIQGFDAQNQPIAMSGSRTAPFTVELKTELLGAEPSLPGRPPPAQCKDKSQETECPPDFPGCKANKKDIGDDCEKNDQCSSGSCTAGKCAEAEKKSGGQSCEGDDECASGACSDGKCSDKKGSGEFCENDNQCVSGSCEDSKCTTPKGEARMNRFWVGLGTQLDIFVMPAATDACIVDPNSGKILTAYQCVDPSSGAHQNFNFPGSTANNQAIVKGNRDGVGGGVAVGNLRLMLSFDYALNKNMLLGARAGYVLFTDSATGTPGRAFAPFHAEVRYTYLVGPSNPLTQGAASLMIFGALGVGEFDAFVPVTVVSNITGSTPLSCSGQSNQVNTNSQTIGACTENAWTTAGPVFAALGTGVRFRLGNFVALPIGVKLEGAFGGSAGFLFGIAPEAYLQFGF
jgi:hypothetical protein